MRFRPCIDLRNGRVVQIVGGTLRDDEQHVQTNFVSEQPPEYYADLYRRDNLPGGHVISLGAGNHEAALAALGAYPDGMQVGGGITPANARSFLDAGASHVIMTSYVFHGGVFDMRRLEDVLAVVPKERLVLDLSCRRRDEQYWIVTDRWQRFTNLKLDAHTLAFLAEYCAEFLIHAVDVEGKRGGVDGDLVALLGSAAPIPTTYAGGARSLDDARLVKHQGHNRVDLSIGSALDLFGGSLPYADVVAWQRQEEASAVRQRLPS